MREDRNQYDFRKEQIWWILLPLVMAVAVAVLMPLYEGYRADLEQRQCLRNMRQIGLWTLTYAADHNGILPTGPDWVDEMGEYIEDPDALICPAAPESGPVSYVLNSDVRGANLNSHAFADSHSIVLLYEGQVGEIVHRHRGGANYCFADGFAEWREEPPGDLEAVVEEP